MATSKGDGGHVWPPREGDERMELLTGSTTPTPGQVMKALGEAGFKGSLDDRWSAYKAANGITSTAEPFTLSTESTPPITAVITGTATASIDEDDIRAGSKTIIITLTNDTWVAAGTGPIGSTAVSDAIIAGISAAASPTSGWNNEIRDGSLTRSNLVRTSNTAATVTIPADADYNITSAETITCTIPASALTTSSNAVIAAPTIAVSAVAAPTVALTGTITSSITEADIVTGGKTIILTLTGATWIPAGTGAIGTTAQTQSIVDGISAASSPTNGWNNEVRDGSTTSAHVVRTSNTVATITVQADAQYDISAPETITATVPAAVITNSDIAVVASPTFAVDATPGGADVYIAKTGDDDSGDGTAGNPYLTIGKGLTALTTGQILEVGAGVYAENIAAGEITSGSIGNYTILRAASGATVQLKPTGGPHAVRLGASGITDTYIELDGFIIGNDDISERVASDVTEAIKLEDDSSFINLKNLEIRYVKGNGILWSDGSDALVEGCHVHHTGTVGSTQSHGIYVGGNTGSGSPGVTRVTVQDCIAEYNEGYNIQIWNSSVATGATDCVIQRCFVRGGGVGTRGGIIVRGNNCTIRNNIITTSTQADGGLIIWSDVDGCSVWNNTIYDCDKEGIDLAGDNCDVRNNIIYGNGGLDIDNAGAGNTLSNNWVEDDGDADPQFTNGTPTEASHFQLGAGSPCRSVGATIAGVTDDYAETARSVPYDIGAYEATV